MGQLIQVSGYLETLDKEPRLRDADGSRRIILDFAKAPDDLAALRARGNSEVPVLVIGRMSGIKDSGKPVLTVIGALNLTP